MELVEAASITGLYSGRYFRPDGQTEHWTPIEVVTLDRGGQTISVVARYLESDEREEFGIRYVSNETNLAPGGVIMLKGKLISLYDTEKMRDRVYQIEDLHQ